MTRLSKAAQDGIVVDLAVDGQNLTEDEFDELYNQLDADHKMKVRQNIREIVDNAVGSIGTLITSYVRDVKWSVRGLTDDWHRDAIATVTAGRPSQPQDRLRAA